MAKRMLSNGASILLRAGNNRSCGSGSHGDHSWISPAVIAGTPLCPKSWNRFAGGDRLRRRSALKPWVRFGTRKRNDAHRRPDLGSGGRRAGAAARPRLVTEWHQHVEGVQKIIALIRLLQKARAMHKQGGHPVGLHAAGRVEDA